ncbi:TBC1 domain family member 15-like [Halichondria panicea]|uniref:TBC1 domain family member 15-like n=1 Tax=Halichondria panicea TaxID=6063 RepID=UPI00312B8D01
MSAANKFKQEVTPGSYASATYPSATYPSANASAPSKPSSGGQVHYEIETSGGQPGVVVYEVHEVYIYIPAELSAAGFELKICGVVRITDKGTEFYLNWKPNDLSHDDVASLYSAQADGWAMVDEIVEPPEMIDSQELKYPDRDYKLSNLEGPDSILSSPGNQATSPTTQSHVHIKDQGVRYRSDGDARVTGIVSTTTPTRLTSKEHPRADTVNFPISKIHSIKESSQSKKCLTFFLTDGRELPTLHFHDGGTGGLIQSLQRYTYLIRDSTNPFLYRVTTFNKSSRSKLAPPQTKTDSPALQNSKPNKPGVENLLQDAVSGFVGITRAVRQHLLPDKKLLDVRPGTENDDLEETIQTVVLSDMKSGRSPPPQAGGKGKSPDDPEASLISDFQIITDIRGKLPVRPAIHPRQPPVSVDEWECFRDDWGRITPEKELRFRGRVMYGGIEEKLRKEAWKYLLGYMPFGDTDIERMDLRVTREEDYWRMKRQWEAFTPDQESRFSKWRETKRLINKDVLRTDRELEMYNDVTSTKLTQLENILRTYVMYNFDLGYVQGMSDLLAPLLSIMDNEVDAFWCFAGLMEIVGHHFELSQAGMRQRLKQLRALLNITDPDFYSFLKEKETHNLYFCFRWLLVNFKREFSYEDIYKIWEVTWTNFLSTDFSLFIALAILQREKKDLENDRYDFSDILQHINGLSKQLPVNSLLETAESLCRQMGSCRSLPEDLQPLLIRPLPSRPIPGSAAVRRTEDTIVCDPNMRAVPSN